MMPAPASIDLDSAWRWVLGGRAPSALQLDTLAPRGWSASGAIGVDVQAFLDIYAPLRRGGPVRCLGHLGQSIDGYVAAPDGESRGLSDPQNIVHLHRLRALFDAVMVGGTTAQRDDPRLTTRLVAGPSPVRVILDPGLKTSPNLTLYSDGRADTVLICSADAPHKAYPGATNVYRVETGERSFLQATRLMLRSVGLARVFVEGGGRLVSSWVAEELLDRLHLAIAPVLMGSGVRGLVVEADSPFGLGERRALSAHPMGKDVLFDFSMHPRVVNHKFTT